MSKSKARSVEKMDEDWQKIRDYVRKSLEGDAYKPTPQDFMKAYTAAFDLETSGHGTWLTRADGTTIHGVRVRMAKLLKALCMGNGALQNEQTFESRWRDCCKIFAYHDRHFVKRMQAEQGTATSVSQSVEDRGNTTMYQLGINVWKEAQTA